MQCERPQWDEYYDTRRRLLLALWEWFMLYFWYDYRFWILRPELESTFPVFFVVNMFSSVVLNYQMLDQFNWEPRIFESDSSDLADTATLSLKLCFALLERNGVHIHHCDWESWREIYLYI